MDQFKFTKEIGDQKIEITVNTNGTFTGEYNGMSAWDQTLDALIKKLERFVKSGRIEHRIYVVIFHNGKYQRAILRGRTRGNKYQFTLANGEKELIDSPKIEFIGSEITNEEIQHLEDLHEHVRLSNEAMRDALHVIRKRNEADREKLLGKFYLTADNLLEVSERQIKGQGTLADPVGGANG